MQSHVCHVPRIGHNRVLNFLNNTKKFFQTVIHSLHYTQKTYRKNSGWVDFTPEFAKNTLKIH